MRTQTARRLLPGLSALCLLAVTAVSCSSSHASALKPASHVHHASIRGIKDVALPAAPPGSTLLATTHGAITGYSTPNGAASAAIPATWHGAVSTLPVVWAAPGWLDVRLAQRPNESTAWVRQSDVSLTSTAYQIRIHLSTMRVELYKSNQLIMSAPAGIGTTADPTPTGHFFVAFFARPPSSGYGPFVLVSSAHSNTISDWESSGDALMAIHGPLGADSAIGTKGARVSHGCVRLHLSDLAQLRVVPAGSPITVTAT